MLAKKAQEEVAVASKLAAEAIEKEEIAYKISHEAMKLVESVDNAEARGVEALQAKVTDRLCLAAQCRQARSDAEYGMMDFQLLSLSDTLLQARTAKEDFFEALQTTKELHERELALGAQCQVTSDSSYGRSSG